MEPEHSNNSDRSFWYKLTGLRGVAIILPLALFGFVYCIPGKENEKGIIQIIDIEKGLGNVRPVYLSEFAKSVSYVPLETKVGLELRGIVSFSSMDTLFFVSDGRVCILYSRTGKVIKQIGSHGRGPGEYTMAERFEVTSVNTLLIQNYVKLLKFDLNGELLGSFNCFQNTGGSGITRNWVSLNDSLLFVHARNDTGEELYKAMLINLAGGIRSGFQNYIHFKQDKKLVASYSGYSSFHRYLEAVGFKEAFNDTLFYLSPGFELVPGYVFNMGRYKVSYMDLINNSAFKREYAYTRDIFETDKHILIILQGLCNAFRMETPTVSVVNTFSGQVINRESWYDTYDLLVIYDKSTANTFLADVSVDEKSVFGQGFINDLDGGPNFYPSFTHDGENLIMSIQSNELKSYVSGDSFKNAPAQHPEKKKALEELADSLSESDNPVLMVVTMK
jgi:hypothetical protein